MKVRGAAFEPLFLEGAKSDVENVLKALGTDRSAGAFEGVNFSVEAFVVFGLQALMSAEHPLFVIGLIEAQNLFDQRKLISSCFSQLLGVKDEKFFGLNERRTI